MQPFEFERYRKEKIRQEIEAQRPSRLQLKSHLPKVNQELALKILEEQKINQKTKRTISLLEDNRFKAIFENPDYNVDKNCEAYKMLTPVLNRLEKSKAKNIEKRIEVSRVEELHAEEAEQPISSDDDLFETKSESEVEEEEESSDDDTKEFSKEMKKTYKQVKRDLSE